MIVNNSENAIKQQVARIASKTQSASKMQFVCKTMQPRSAREDSKAIVARSAVGGARRAFELDPTAPKGVAAWSTRHQINGAPKANFTANLCLDCFRF